MELGKKLSQMIFLVLRARKRKKKRKRIFYQTHHCQVTIQIPVRTTITDPQRSLRIQRYNETRFSSRNTKCSITIIQKKILLGHRIEEKPKEKERLKSYLPRVIGSQYRTQDVHLVNRFL